MSDKKETLEQIRARLAGAETARKCKECGYRIRGVNHEEGTHHQSKVQKDDNQ